MTVKKVTTNGRERPQVLRGKPSGRAGGAACPDGLNLPRTSRAEFAAGLRDEIAELTARLDELEAGLESAGWEDPGGFRALLEEARLRLKAAAERTEELEAGPDRQWTPLRSEAEEALSEAGRSVENLAAELERYLPE